MPTNEDNVEVVSDYPLETGEIQTETETPQTEEALAEPVPTEVDKSANRKEIETLLAQKEHWRKKFQELEKKSKSSLATGTEQDDEFRPRVEFLLENRDLNADEYDHLAATALRKSGKVDLGSLREAKDAEAEYISFLRKKAESKNKIPSSTAVSGFARLQKTPEEIAKMTPAEHAKYDALLMAEQDKRGQQI